MTSLNNKNQQLPSEADPKAAKQKATEDKYRLFGAMQAIRQGKMPHNDQLEDLLKKLAQNEVIQSREHLVSQDGKNLLNDFRELIYTLQKALQTKNKDELFQSMVYHLHCMESPVSKDNLNSATKNNHSKDSMKSEGKKASESLWRIGKLILVNNEFRSLLGDMIDISQDIFTSVTTKLGDSLKDTGDNLQENSQRNQRPGKELVDSALDRGVEDFETARDNDSRRSSQLVSSDPSDTRHVGLLNTGDSVHPNAIPNDMPSIQQEPQVADNTARNQSQTNKDLTNTFKDRATHHYNTHKQHARETVSERVPKEKQDELIHRLQLVLAQIQKHPDYQSAIETLIDLVKTWSGRLSKMSNDIEVQKEEPSRETAEREFKKLVESWAQGHSMDPLLRGVQDVMKDARQDPELREYYHTVMDYIKRLVREPGYASDDESMKEGERLMDRGRQVLHGNYDDHLRFLSRESKSYMNLMAEDEISRELNDRVSKIHHDLWMDSEGNPAFKPHLLNDIKMTLLPAFMDEIRYIPVPRIEYSDKQYDVAVENLVISGDTLLPNKFDTKIESFNSFSLKTDESKPSSQSLLIRMSEIQADIDDVVFWYKKKTGFPKIQDRGVASLAVGGKGISLVVRLHSSNDPSKTFKVEYCKCTVDNLKLKVNESRHSILYKTITPLLIGTIRKQIARSIETMVTERLVNFDQRITRSIVGFNQRLQDKKFESLPEHKKQNGQSQKVSTEQSRPGLWSTLVSIMNNNIRTRVENRNEKMRQKKRQSSDLESSGQNTRGSCPSDQFKSTNASSDFSSVHDHENDISSTQNIGNNSSFGRGNSNDFFSSQNNQNQFPSTQGNRNDLFSDQNRNEFSSTQNNRNEFSSAHDKPAGLSTQGNRNDLFDQNNRNDFSPARYNTDFMRNKPNDSSLQYSFQNEQRPLQGKRIDSPPPSPKKTHDHGSDYKLATDLSKATSPTH